MTGAALDACRGKEAFASFTLAAKTARRVSSGHETAMQPYHCPHCHKFHVGKLSGRAPHPGRRPPRRVDDGEA